MCLSYDASSAPDPIRIGRIGEDLAAAFLLLRGYRITARNVRCGPREIDLVAEKDDWIIVVEVRYRRNCERGRPDETVQRRKCTHLLRAGMSYWLGPAGGRGRVRFDLISIFLTGSGLQLRHYPHFIVPGRGLGPGAAGRWTRGSTAYSSPF